MSTPSSTTRRAKTSGPAALPAPGPSGTKERLLDAAEVLFGDRGFAGTSMRALAEAAGTSVSAAHYHFGSKQALLREALRRRLDPITRRQLRALDRAEARAGDGPPSVEATLRAFLAPPLEASRTPGPEGEGRRMAARLYADPGTLESTLRAELLGPVVDRFVATLARAVPELPESELAARFRFTIGALILALSRPPLTDGERPQAPAAREDDLAEQLVAFASAGLRAGGAGHVAGPVRAQAAAAGRGGARPEARVGDGR